MTNQIFIRIAVIEITNDIPEFELDEIRPILDDVQIVDIPKLQIANILDYWPMEGSPPRKSQIDALQWIEKLPPKIKYILCEIPVGGGKSPLAINTSAWINGRLGDSFILTPQRILQKQYEESFNKKYIGTLYGRANYECTSKKTNCDIGGDIKPMCRNCPARTASEIAFASPNVVLNYTLAFLLFKYNMKIRPRKLMVFDECHTLEHHLTEFNMITISESKCKKVDVKYEKPKSIETAMEFIDIKYTKKLRDKVKDLEEMVKLINEELDTSPRALSSEEQQAVRNFKELSAHYEAIIELSLMPLPEIKKRYVLVHEDKSFKFKELYGKHVFQSFVKPMADRFLFMSSTILNKEAFCNELGLDPEEAAFLSLPSEFPVENRPVMFMPVMKMSYGWNSDANRSERHNMLMQIKEICELHPDQSGIIHTASFQVANWLVSELSGFIKHDIMHHNPESQLKRDDVVDEFLRVSPKQPTILISPSITEGLDLKHDLSRFAIIVKVPYPFLGDAWIEKRKDISQEWYSRQAMISIIQGAGRVVRSKDDWGYTYILDSSFNYLYYSANKQIPNWWKEGYQKV